MKSIKTAWESARNRAGVPGLLVHELRRTPVRNMSDAGVHDKVAMMISGHKTRSMLDRYNIVTGDAIQSAGAKMAAYAAEKAKIGIEVGTVAVGAGSGEPASGVL